VIDSFEELAERLAEDVVIVGDQDPGGHEIRPTGTWARTALLVAAI
jgi:hypothetical protein